MSARPRRTPVQADVDAFLMLQLMGYYAPREDWPALNAAFYDFRNSPEWDPAVVACAQRRWASVRRTVEREGV